MIEQTVMANRIDDDPDERRGLAADVRLLLLRRLVKPVTCQLRLLPLSVPAS